MLQRLARVSPGATRQVRPGSPRTASAVVVVGQVAGRRATPYGDYWWTSVDGQSSSEGDCLCRTRKRGTLAPPRPQQRDPNGYDPALTQPFVAQ